MSKIDIEEFDRLKQLALEEFENSEKHTLDSSIKENYLKIFKHIDKLITRETVKVDLTDGGVILSKDEVKPESLDKVPEVKEVPKSSFKRSIKK